MWKVNKWISEGILRLISIKTVQPYVQDLLSTLALDSHCGANPPGNNGAVCLM